MPKAFQVMNLMPKYKAPPADIQPSSMGPKWLDCKNHCLKYMSVFLGLLIVLLISSKVWWLFQLPCESSTCVHWSYLCSWPGITIFLVSKTKKCWDQELVHLLAAEASSQANGSSQAVLGPKHGLLGLLLLLKVLLVGFFCTSVVSQVDCQKPSPWCSWNETRPHST